MMYSLHGTSKRYSTARLRDNLLSRYIMTAAKSITLGGVLTFGHEVTYKCIVGHPDVMTVDCAYDIKTTSSMKSHANNMCLQLLTYAAITKRSKCGFILPLQREVQVYNLSSWDPREFLNRLVRVEINPMEAEMLMIRVVL